MTSPIVYLDHAATTLPDEAVVEQMTRCLTEAWNNPSSGYFAAGKARKELRLARQALADLLHVRQEELVFTSGGTEANALSLWQAAGKHVVLSAVEHPSVLENARGFDCQVTLVAPDENGVIQPEAVEAAIRPDTALVSVQYANNETGVIHPITEIAKTVKARKLLFHVDAVQAAGQIPLDLEQIGADMVSVSAHKLYGPRGAGCLYVRRGTRLRPLLSGGGQENGMRSGTENVPAIAGFGVAAKLAKDDLPQRMQRETSLRLSLEKQLHQAFPSCQILGEMADRLPGITAVRFPGVGSEWLIAQLDLMGVQVSGGAACGSHTGQPSHVYRAMGLNVDEADQVIRLSLGRHTTEGHITRLMECLKTILKV